MKQIKRISALGKVNSNEIPSHCDKKATVQRFRLGESHLGQSPETITKYKLPFLRQIQEKDDLIGSTDLKCKDIRGLSKMPAVFQSQDFDIRYQ